MAQSKKSISAQSVRERCDAIKKCCNKEKDSKKLIPKIKTNKQCKQNKGEVTRKTGAVSE